MIKLRHGNGPTVRNLSLADRPFSAQHFSVAAQTSGGSYSIQTVADMLSHVWINATYHYEGSILLTGAINPQITNLSPRVGTIGSDLSITRLTVGIMNLRIRSAGLTIPLTLDLTNKTAAETQPVTYVATVSGSLAAHCQSQIDNRINSTMTMATNGKVFTTQAHDARSYTRNPNLWCADVDLTCISPWNTQDYGRKAGTLITPRHVLNAAHYELNVGSTIRFVGADGSVHDRVITGKRRHPDYVPYRPDLTVYTLATDLPVGITPCLMMPSDWNSYLVNNSSNRPPVLGLDQEEKALIVDLLTAGAFQNPVANDRLIFHEDKVNGDSGNPYFLIVGGELVLITVLTYGFAGSGTPVAPYLADLNQMIVDADAQAGVTGDVANAAWPHAGGHYQVKPADFSAFPNYGTP